MADGVFEATIRQFFTKHELGAPRFDQTGIVRLQIGDLAVNLSSDGHRGVIVQGRIGLLSRERSRRAAQLRDVLRSNTGLLLVNAAGTFISSGPGAGTESLMARALHRADGPPGGASLDEAIEDVLALMSHHAPILERWDGPAAGEALRRGSAPEPEEAIIFRL
ncbi:hypothetical protein [Aureimonas jatrophae]|uniref:Tir chaperone protein (CesT) family protein n=1 Tax=Aureimonas jatrophae TaxID=1166073 RepID=A0A1H0ESD0_9HYPH|nr:hypothetical protein [Aureimonas jatrophae]MBB3950335.1 hypothetical protein [Aureimonas jatrophae]SDN85367.1 hypothetical protein SAMN05192530_102200 [Aureimonas jatrophae]